MREIAQKLCKKLLERKKVARNATSCQKVGEKLVDSSREKGEGLRGGRLLNKALFGEASPRGPVPYPLRVSSIKKLYPLYLLRENKSVRKEVFRSFSSNLNM